MRVVPRDTDVTPYDMGTLGSRSLFHMGHAVRRAAEEARDKLKALAQEVGEPEGSNIPIAELFQKRYGMQAGNIIGTGIYKPDYIPPAPGTGQSPNVTPFWMVAGAGAEVEVDTETGHVKITKLVNVVDCGKAINPKIVETQISGAALMQLGFTMFEKMHIDGGQVTNASLADYKIPGFHDVPDVMENDYIEHDQSNGPFGAKGVGEVATFCVVAGDRQRHRRCRRRAHHGDAAERRDGLSRDPRQSRASRWRTNDMTAARTITFTLNGAPVTADVKPHHNLVEMLQNQFGLTGARESCGQGLCGCCTVVVNGTRRVGLSLSRAVRRRRRGARRSKASTRRDKLSPVQEAFIEASAFQCGYCTPGFIMMMTQLLDENPDPTDDQIKHYLTGNLCRCAAYPEIMDAVKLAAKKTQGRRHRPESQRNGGMP